MGMFKSTSWDVIMDLVMNVIYQKGLSTSHSMISTRTRKKKKNTVGVLSSRSIPRSEGLLWTCQWEISLETERIPRQKFQQPKCKIPTTSSLDALLIFCCWLYLPCMALNERFHQRLYLKRHNRSVKQPKSKSSTSSLDKTFKAIYWVFFFFEHSSSLVFIY